MSFLLLVSLGGCFVCGLLNWSLFGRTPGHQPFWYYPLAAISVPLLPMSILGLIICAIAATSKRRV